jgi:hypothetical protein
VSDLPLTLCAVQHAPVLLSCACARREVAWPAWDFTWPLGARKEGRRREAGRWLLTGEWGAHEQGVWWLLGAWSGDYWLDKWLVFRVCTCI